MERLSTRNPLRYEHAIAVARLWCAAGGRREVELGALEPLLWRDGALSPADLVNGLAQVGLRVTMTTNASLLEKMATGLRNAGLSLLRISWHTTNPARYRQISGHGDYATFQAGIEAAAAAGLRISFNRVLIRDFTEDIPTQLDFISKHGLRLKLYDLMWTPEIDSVYRDMYQDWRPVIRQYVLPRTLRLERIGREVGRRRLRFHLTGGASVEVKLGDRLNRSNVPCSTCQHRTVCLEEFADYFRVEPELNAYYCYLRRDISFSLRELIQSEYDGALRLRDNIACSVGPNVDTFLRSASLRYIVVPYCNYNCFLPGTSVSWCHKTSGDYSFPGRPRTAQKDFDRTLQLIRLNPQIARERSLTKALS